MRRVVVVIAHADDEVFATSLLRRLADSGADITIACLTDGANNPKTDMTPCGTDDAKTCRRRELERSAALLGVKRIIRGEIVDGELPAQRQRAAGIVTQVLRAQRADTVVTFEPSGISRHPDHMAALDVSALAMSTLSETPRLLMITPSPLLRFFMGTDLETNEHPDRLRVPIDKRLRHLKARVIREAYPSQHRTLSAGTLFVPPEVFFSVVRSEHYYWYEPKDAERYVEQRTRGVNDR